MLLLAFASMYPAETVFGVTDQVLPEGEDVTVTDAPETAHPPAGIETRKAPRGCCASRFLTVYRNEVAAPAAAESGSIVAEYCFPSAAKPTPANTALTANATIAAPTYLGAIRYPRILPPRPIESHCENTPLSNGSLQDVDVLPVCSIVLCRMRKRHAGGPLIDRCSVSAASARRSPAATKRSRVRGTAARSRPAARRQPAWLAERGGLSAPRCNPSGTGSGSSGASR